MEQPFGRCSTRKTILEATLKIIGEEGIQNVTVRKIATLAKVNVAAVNYHFGSKNAVINEALRYLTGKLKDAFLCLSERNVAAERRLWNFIKSYADAALEHPDVFRNFISQSMFGDEIPCNYVEFIMQEGIVELKKTLVEIDPDRVTSDEQLLMKCFQIISVIAFPVLLGKQMHNVSGISYEDPSTRYQYLELLMDNVTGKVSYNEQQTGKVAIY